MSPTNTYNLTVESLGGEDEIKEVVKLETEGTAIMFVCMYVYPKDRAVLLINCIYTISIFCKQEK